MYQSFTWELGPHGLFLLGLRHLNMAHYWLLEHMKWIIIFWFNKSDNRLKGPSCTVSQMYDVGGHFRLSILWILSDKNVLQISSMRRLIEKVVKASQEVDVNILVIVILLISYILWLSKR
jgi:hypothetical protein